MKTVRSILLAATTLLYMHSGMAAIKCWTNSEGYRECGNVVPPEYSQQETRTLNNRGVTTDVKRRAKSREEVEQERALVKKQKMAAQEAKIRKREQDVKDRVLLATFLTAEEIIAARDRKSAVYDGYIELGEIALGKLKDKLEIKQSKIVDFELNGQPVPETIMAQIQVIRNQISLKESFIRQKKAEKSLLFKKYDADYQRFMELKRGRI